MLLFRSVLLALSAALAGTIHLAATLPAVGAGFLVKPMVVQAEVPAGRDIEIPIEIAGVSSTEEQTVNIEISDLTQTSSGAWRPVPPGDPSVEGAQSAAGWIVAPPESLTVPALDPAILSIRMQVPSSARGTYLAALLVSSPAPEGEGLRLAVRFLIPLILTIENRPVRQQVSVAGVSLIDTAERDPAKPSTHAVLTVANEGLTFSRISGTVEVHRKVGENWRHVTKTDFPDRSIIPGVTLGLEADLGRRFPGGDYRLRAMVEVDGRRVRPLETEIAFAGDPSIDTLAYDTALRLDPEIVTMEVTDGASRTDILSVENPGDLPVVVEASAATPDGFLGRALGNMRGDELSAAPLVEIRPARFTLRPRGRQNVRVMARLPKDYLQHPNYYADLVLTGTYSDGQTAGTSRSLIKLARKDVATTPKMVLDRVELSRGDGPGLFVLKAEVVNVGLVEFEPNLAVRLRSEAGATVASPEMQGGSDAVLPLGSRQFGGLLDVSDLEPGEYLLEVSAAAGGSASVTEQLQIEISDSGSSGVAAKEISIRAPQQDE